MVKENPGGRLTREQWTLAALHALARGGHDALRVEPLAKSLGVTKGSFYWHFDDRQALHQAVMEAWEHLATEQIIKEVDASGAESAEDRLRTLAHLVFRGDPAGDAIEPAIRVWARTDPAVAEAAGRVDQRRLDYVSALLRDAGLEPELASQRAHTLYRTLIGEFVWRTSGGPTITAAELDDLADLLSRRP